MKKIVFIFSLIVLAGCSKLKAKDIPLSQVLNEIKVVAEFNNTVTENLTDIKTASQYGINPNAISEGYVYYSLDENVSDEVIIVRATSQEEVEEVEKALAAELSAKTASWQDNEKESKKLENHIMRTIGDCILLAIADNSNEIDQVFNQIKES